MNSTKTVYRLAIAWTLAAGLVGCEPRRDLGHTAFQEGSHDYVCVVAIDLSGSFQHQMAEQGRAYDFLMTLLKKYYDQHSGSADRIVVVQLSGTQRSMLWAGTPRELRMRFPTASAFRDFLNEKADPNGSMIYEGLLSAFTYVASDPRVASGKARSGFFVLSDMMDNHHNREESLQKLLMTMSQYASQGNAIGLYYVDQLELANWKQRLQDAGFKDFCVEPDFVGTPVLPNLEL